MATSAIVTSNVVAKSLTQRFPVKRFALAAVLLSSVALLGFISLNLVKGKAHLIVDGTLPGLSEAGLGNANLSEDFNCTLLMSMADTPAEKAKYRAESEQFARESRQFVDSYEKVIVSPGDHANYLRLLKRRQEYLAVRQQVFALVDNGRNQEALTLCRESLFLHYKAYQAAGEHVLAYNIDRGEARGESILLFCRFTQYAVAGGVIALFLLGFIIGVFK